MGAFIERSVERDPRSGSGRPTGWSAASRAASIRRSAAALLAQALGPRVVCVFVDNGLLRAGERDAVAEAFGAHSDAELRVVDAARPLPRRPSRGVTDPQEKRVRIGHTFIDVFRDEAQSIPGARFLAQGTLYPDVIESGGEPRRPGGDDQASTTTSAACPPSSASS